MPINSLIDAATARLTPPGGIPNGPALTDSQADFASVLGRAPAPELTKKEQSRKAAEQLVSVALVQPILQQMRQNTWAAAPFAPSQGERTFRTMMDSEMAQRLVRSQHWGLVDAVARRVLRETGQPAADANAATKPALAAKPSPPRRT